MKHRSKKKGHTHGKHHHRHHKHGTATSHDGETVPATSPSLPHADSASPAGNQATETREPRRSSICEYCGAAAVTSDGYEDDNFDCMDDCERFSSVDVNAVTCLDAYQLRSPDLTAFYCQCGVVLGEIHALLRPSNDRPSYFTESVVLQMRPKLVALFKGMWRLGVGRDLPASSAPVFESEDDYEETSAARGGRSSPSRRGRTCPFVMVLSVLLPVLHKFLQFTQQTNPHWWLRTSTASFSSAAVLDLLVTQMQLHDILTLVIAEGDQLAQLMEESQERDHDVAQLAQLQPLTTRGSGACSSSSSSSSSLASSHSHFGPATDRDAALGRFPQIKKISFEFDEWLAECKFELAELSEAMAENVEITALRLSRFPPLGLAIDGPPKAKSTASEFVESLMKLVLQPLSERVVTTPSASRSYIFPRVVDRCICVVIDEYVVENGKWTAQAASQFEKAIELLRAWGLSVDTEYDRQVINAPRDVARLSLLSIDAFRRLDILLHSWLRHGKDGEPYVPRLTFKTNLENLRSTLKKTMTARGNTSNGTALSGLATPPPPGQ